MTPLIITRKHLRNLMLILCSTLLITIFCETKYVSAKEKSSPSQQVDGGNVVVEVNGIKLTQNEIDATIKARLESIRGAQLEDGFENYKRFLENMAIKNFIARTLVNQEIDKQNIVVSEDEIQQRLNEVKANIPKGMSLETMLKQNVTSIEDLRKNITYSIRMNKLFKSQLKHDYTPSGEDIKQYYTNNKRKFDSSETVHARHILIKLDEKDDEKAKGEKKTKIEGLRKKLLEGADFKKLAKVNSECPSKEKGGDLGILTRGRMLNLKPFEDAAFSQKVNEIGPIVQTKLGYHIIQVLEHNQAKQKSFDEVKDKVREKMIQKKNRDTINNYIDELNKKAKIVHHTTDATRIPLEINVAGSPFRGPSDAPVVVVVFSDFECSSCARVSLLLEQVLKIYPKEAKLVFKNYPLINHKYARNAAAAALAAAKQGKFWEFHDLLFENQAELSDLKIKEISQWLDLNWEKLSIDMEKPEILTMIDSDKSEGDRAGIEEVPAIFINGRRLETITWPGVRAVIENELQKFGKQAMGSGHKISTEGIEHVEGEVVK